MSQRECAGFNWPPARIPASEPVSSSPETVSRAGPSEIAAAIERSCGEPLRSISDNEPSAVRTFFSPSAARVVGHPVVKATACRSPPPDLVRPSSCFLAALSAPPGTVRGVGHTAACATRPSVTCTLRPSGVWPVGLVPSGKVCPPLGVVGEGHAARCTAISASPIWGSVGFRLPKIGGLAFASTTDALGVGQPDPPEPLSDMGRAEARSAGIDRPCGVARCFQVRRYKVEPSEAVLARNLLSKNDIRSALLDEPVEGWPEVPLVSKPSAFARRAERLARARAGPDWLVVAPSGAAQGVGPDADPGEEVDLDELSQVVRVKVFDAPLVHNAGGDMPLLDQLAQPRSGFRVNLVVQRGHMVPFSMPSLCPASAVLSTAPCA